MGIFNFKITPKVKDRDWEIKVLMSSRKDKNCAFCGRGIGRVETNVSFTKRTSIGANNMYDTHYTHGPKTHNCTIRFAEKLNIEL